VVERFRSKEGILMQWIDQGKAVCKISDLISVLMGLSFFAENGFSWTERWKKKKGIVSRLILNCIRSHNLSDSFDRWSCFFLRLGDFVASATEAAESESSADLDKKIENKSSKLFFSRLNCCD
jgi:hypothetical protein